jgi:hypothetical protein
MAELSEINWAPFDGFGQPASDTIAARNIVAGFAPDNAGAQNTKALRLDTSTIPGTTGDNVAAGYTLQDDLGLLPDEAQTIRAWVIVDQTGPEEQAANIGLKIRPNLADPADIPTGVLMNFTVGAGNLNVLSAVVSQAGAPEFFDFGVIPFADPSKPFLATLKFEEIGSDLVVAFEVFDELGVSIYNNSTTSIGSDIVGFNGDVLIGASGAIGQVGSGCSFDDVHISTETGLTPLPPIAQPAIIDFEDASWD